MESEPYSERMVEVFHTDEFEAWFKDLDASEQQTVGNVVTLLEQTGLALSFPHTSQIKQARHALRELRPQRGNSPLRIIYAFDPNRDAVLILGGDKSNDKRFYEKITKASDLIWDEYLKEHEEGLHEEPKP